MTATQAPTPGPLSASRVGTNSGHGHAWKRPDGMKARCGGPGMCAVCSKDAALVADVVFAGKQTLAPTAPVEASGSEREEMFGVSGAADEVEALACAIWAHRCPGLLMDEDDDRPHYMDAARAAFTALEDTTPARAEAQDEGAAGERSKPGGWYVSSFEINAGGNDRVVMGGDGFMVARLMGRSEAEHDALAKLIVEAVNAHPSPTPAADVQKLESERDAWKLRGDNHWETLRSIREFAREGDCERIIQWVNDAGSGYTESTEQTLGKMTDRALKAEASLASPPAADADRVREAFDAGVDVGYRDITGRDAPQAFKDKKWPEALAALKSGGKQMARTYEIKETRRAKIVGGINGAKRRRAAAFCVVETTGGREKLVLETFNADFANQRLSYLREHLS